MTRPRRILVADRDTDMVERLRSCDLSFPLDLCHAWSGMEVISFLERAPPDLVLAALDLPEPFGGVAVCREVRQGWPDVPVVLFAATPPLEAAVDAFRAGAADFLSEPGDPVAVARSVERSLRARRRTLPKARARNASVYPGLVGVSRSMRRVYRLLEKAGSSELPVLITGETGTGKEVVARVLHEQGARAGGPFHAVNCAALPRDLAESELFGHRAGSFTDARQDRKGLFLESTRGTLLLDEVGELDLQLQAKLLRVLEERTIRAVGSDREVEIDARLLFATNRDLSAFIRAGRFREDLYFRINVLEISLPPLRDRGEDVLLLAEHFLDRARRSDGGKELRLLPETSSRLLEYPWPGNVRELRNCMERAAVLADDEGIEIDHLSEPVRRFHSASSSMEGEELGDLPTLAEVERRYIERVLAAAGGNKQAAALVLGINRGTLYRKLEKYAAEDRPAGA